jgi:4-hydroxybenzoate polyprenyltransferase
MYKKLLQFLELIRFSHTLFALPFALFSAVLAWEGKETGFEWRELLGIILCMVFARTAAMGFNRVVDYQIDAKNPRTEGRHIPAGLISIRMVSLFVFISAAGFIFSTLIFLPNPWPIRLSVPFLLFLLGYSYSKRFTSLCHYWLSAALMLSPLGSWIAIRGELAWPPVLLGIVIFFWVGGFDIIYACQDEEYDREKGLFSIPSRWGISKALKIAFVSHLLMIIALVGFWYVSGLGYIFLLGVVVVSLLLLYEHKIVRPDDLTRVNIAFFNINSLVSIGLFLLGLIDTLVGA